MLFVTFYTPDYEIPLRRLLRSCERHGVRIAPTMIPTMGRTWREMVRVKPEFVQSQLVKYIGIEPALVWIDADSIINRYPELFDRIDCDIATRLWDCDGSVIEPEIIEDLPAEPAKYEPMTGVMYFRNTRAVRRLVTRWVEHIKGFAPERKRPEQRALAETLSEAHGLRYASLPMAYCFWKRYHPHKSHPALANAYIHVTRWKCKDPEKAHAMALEEKRQRETGAWVPGEWS